MKIFATVLLSLLLLNISAQPNIVKNGDFQETEGNFEKTIKRIDIEFGSPKHWNCISVAGVHLVAADADISDKKFRADWDKQRTIEAQKIADKNDILVGLSIQKATKDNPFSRRYLVGQLSYPLIKDKKYKVALRFNISDYPCVGMLEMGLKLDSIYPNVYDLSPRIDTSIVNFKLPKTYGIWVELDTVVVAKGDEKYLTLGCFMKESDLKLYQLNKKGKKTKCPDDLPQAFLISKVSIQALDSAEWRWLKKDSTLRKNTVTTDLITSDTTPTIQGQHKKYILEFPKNAYDINENAFQIISNDIQKLKNENIPYKIELTGHTDQEGSLEYNQKLSQKRVMEVQNLLLQTGVSEEQIKLDYFGETQLISAEEAMNRRVEVLVRYNSTKQILD